MCMHCVCVLCVCFVCSCVSVVSPTHTCTCVCVCVCRAACPVHVLCVWVCLLVCVLFLWLLYCLSMSESTPDLWQDRDTIWLTGLNRFICLTLFNLRTSFCFTARWLWLYFTFFMHWEPFQDVGMILPPTCHTSVCFSNVAINSGINSDHFLQDPTIVLCMTSSKLLFVPHHHEKKSDPLGQMTSTPQLKGPVPPQCWLVRTFATIHIFMERKTGPQSSFLLGTVVPRKVRCDTV